MSDLLKKPYEISLWDDEIIWRRQLLKVASFNNENPYKIGAFYSASNTNGSSNLYVLDYEPYDRNKIYYEPDERPIIGSGNKIEYAFKESQNISDLNAYNENNEKQLPVFFYNSDNSLKPSIIFQYFKEKKNCTIGSNTMNTPVRAFNPKFTTKVNGSSTLTFQMFYRYYDDETDEFERNPFLKLLVNERKVKLKYDGKWYDLIIKNIQENSDQKTFTYTCQDMFITELSKTGFDIQLDAELENNTGTVIDLAKTVMEGTDWKIGDDPGLKQYKNESLYELVLGNQIQATKLLEKDSQKIEANEKIYAFYTDIESQLSTLQFLYIPETETEIKYDDNYIITNGINCEITEVEYENGAPTFTKKQSGGENLPLKTLIKYQGKKLIRKEKVVYDSKIDKYVNCYSLGKDDNGDHIIAYGYTKTDYVSPTAVKNYIVNNSDFTSTTGWSVGTLKSEIEQPDLVLGTNPSWEEVTPNEDGSVNVVPILNFYASNNQQVLVNSGMVINRSIIRTLTIDDLYRFGIKTLDGDESFTIKIGSYDFSGLENIYTIKDIYFQGENIKAVSSDKEWGQNTTTELKCKVSLSYSDLISENNIGIFIIPNLTEEKQIKIIDVQFFPYKTYKNTEDQEVMATPQGTFVDQGLIKTKYFYYEKESQYTSLEEIKYLYEGFTPASYPQLYYDDFKKIRSITVSESNRFNIMQDLCEIFECWAKFETKHDPDTGEITGVFKDGKYCQDKTIIFKEYQGQENAIGFKYGLNLKSIQRTLDSAGISSKLIVKNNSNEFAKNGFCSIARAKDNPSGENFIFDFGYYINQTLVDLMEVNNDLRLRDTAQGYIGLYPRLKEQNILRDRLVEEQAALMVDIMNYQADLTTWSTTLQQTEENLANKKSELRSLTKREYNELFSDYLYVGKVLRTDFKKEDEYYEKNGESYVKAENWNENTEYYLKNTWKTHEEALSIITAITVLSANRPRYERLKEIASENLHQAELLKENVDSQLKQIAEIKEAIISQFYSKYSRFIQEGSWISEDYVDDNLYYLDAENTLHASSQPKVTYAINVLELSQLEGYENLHFEVGDVSYIEDTEFFGWVYKIDIKTPYREEIIVNEITYALDSPEQNTIKVQNYKTQFEDLFQRITATSQAVEYATGRVNKAVSIVREDGTIEPLSLANSMAGNSFVLSNAKDQSVIIDENGITTTSLATPSEMLRIISGGLFLSKDGGQNWTTGISAKGINASYINAGVLDTGVIRIMNGSFPTFVWNTSGLNAYRFNNNGIFPNTFVRFDQYGLYGISNYSTEGAEFNPSTPDEQGGPIGEEKIKNNSTFALTWSGLQLGSRKNGGYISVSAENDFQVFQIKEDSVLERIKIGKLDNNSYGIYFKNDGGNITLQTDNNGNLNLTGYLGISGWGSYKAKFGMLKEIKIEDDTTINQILTVQGKPNKDESTALSLKTKYGFTNSGQAIAMFDDGTFICDRMIADHLYGTNVNIEGKINATGGTIGNLTIDEVVQSSYTVVITSDSGYSFPQDDDKIILTARVLNSAGEEMESGENYNFIYKWSNNQPGQLDENTNKTFEVNQSDINAAGGIVYYYCTVTLDPIKNTGQ